MKTGAGIPSKDQECLFWKTIELMVEITMMVENNAAEPAPAVELHEVDYDATQGEAMDPHADMFDELNEMAMLAAHQDRTRQMKEITTRQMTHRVECCRWQMQSCCCIDRKCLFSSEMLLVPSMIH